MSVAAAPPAADASLSDMLTNAAAVVGAVLTLGGLAWWLLKPRIEDWLEQLAKAATSTAEQLDPTTEGSTAANVRQALELASGIPALINRVQRIERELEPLPGLEQRSEANSARLDSTELELIDHRRRLGNLEEAAITGRFAQHAPTMESH